jgi:hypothetical protein
MPLHYDGNIYKEAAEDLIRHKGYQEAVIFTVRLRDMNSEGTISFAFHNAVLKQIKKIGPQI